MTNGSLFSLETFLFGDIKSPENLKFYVFQISLVDWCYSSTLKKIMK